MRERNPRLFVGGCGLGSSMFTSSNLSSSCVCGTCKGRWKELEDLGGDWKVRLSKDPRGLGSAGLMTGDRADISCTTGGQFECLKVFARHEIICGRLTNDLRYESKDSREMLNCSFSCKAERRMDEDVVDLDDVVPQKLLRSVGEGGRKTPESLISIED